MYSNIPREQLASSSDSTVSTFEQYNSVPLQLDNTTLTAMIGFLETRGFANESAETIAITILEQAKKDGYNGMEIIETVKGLNQAQLSALVAEILNYNRYKSSSIGIVQGTRLVPNISRNILA
jgi:hypothetical protein